VKMEVADGWRCIHTCPIYGGDVKSRFDWKFMVPTDNVLVVDEEYVNRMLERREHRAHHINQNGLNDYCPRCGYSLRARTVAPLASAK